MMRNCQLWQKPYKPMIDVENLSVKNPADGLAEEIQEIINDVGMELFANALEQTTFRGVNKNENANREALTWIVSKITASRRPAMIADCIALAAGIYDRQNVTQTDIARRHAVTRANISREVLEVQADLGLQKCACNKSEKAQQTYKRTNSRT